MVVYYFRWLDYGKYNTNNQKDAKLTSTYDEHDIAITTEQLSLNRGYQAITCPKLG